MNILILGGTQFIGRHIVAAALDHGHNVSVLTRGRTLADLPASVERLIGDRNDGPNGLAALSGREWDACIDLSGYTPLQVKSSADYLSSFLRRYVFISTASVYVTPGAQPVTEANPLVEPAQHELTTVNNETYGPLKVTCENIVTSIYDTRATILRPQIVAGPYDHTGRHTYWVSRGPSVTPVAMPGDGSDYMQVIDARDLAAFAVKVLEDNVDGIFDVAGPRITWKDFANYLGIAQPVWISPDLMDQAGIDISTFPMFIPSSSSKYAMLMNISAHKALAAGLTLSQPLKTISDTRPWSVQQQYPHACSAEVELRLLALAR